jgi:NDP-sugar pyrophosphorylase family protein
MQAIILAGGKATRMRPYTDDRPKAMVEVAGVPIIERQIRWLVDNGVKDLVVSCGYRSEVINDHLAALDDLGVSIAYAVEDEPLGRGGGLKYAARQLPDPESFCFALNGDVIAGFALQALLDHHRSAGAVATIALAPYRTTWGIAELDGDLVKGFVQSPILPYWINGGIYALEPECIELLPDLGDHEDSTFPQLAAEGRLAGYKIEGYWRGIDTVKDVLTASEELSGAPG